MSDSLAGLLERAVESYERHEDEEALQWLLEAWREVRVERLAELAERLSMLANRTAPRPGLLGLQYEFERVMTLEKDGRFAPESMVCLLEDFRKQPADPRLTLAMLDLASRPMAHEERIFLPLCELFLHMKDPCALKPLHMLLASLPHTSPYQRTLHLTLERMDVGPAPALREEEADLCEALQEALDLRQKFPGMRPTRGLLRGELFARVHAAPDDDEARMVLADHLLELDDPLGEFIMLQCQPQPDEARVASLLEKHGAEWETVLLGDKNVEYRQTRFERGLPVAVQLTRQGLSPPGPAWCTIREIDWNWRDDVEWLAHPHLRNVTVLRNMTCDVAARLGTHPLPVRRLVMVRRYTTASHATVFNALAALPHLTWLELREGVPEEVRLCAASPLARRLERFEVSATGAWSLVVAPAEEVPVEATLMSDEHSEVLARVLDAAAAMSHRALRIHSRRRLGAGRRRVLEEAASGYTRVEWRPLPR